MIPNIHIHEQLMFERHQEWQRAAACAEWEAGGARPGQYTVDEDGQGVHHFISERAAGNGTANGGQER